MKRPSGSSNPCGVDPRPGAAQRSTLAALGLALAVAACGAKEAHVSRPDPVATAALLLDANPAVRQEALRVLESLGAAAAPVVPALIAALADPDPRVREGAGKTLTAVGPVAAEAVPNLIRATMDEDDFVRLRAIQALGAIGPKARAAIPSLEAHAVDADEVEDLKLYCKESLRLIRGGDGAGSR